MLKQTHPAKLGALALILTLPAMVMADSFIEEFDEVFDTAQGQNLKLSVSSGNVVISSHPGNQLSANIKMSVKAKNQDAADKAMASVEKIIEQNGDTITIKLKQKQKSGWLGFKNHSIKTLVTISCPENYNLDVDTGSGNIEVTNVSGALSFDTGSGNVSGSMLSGEIEVDTGSGNVHLVDVEGDVEGDTGSGNIVVKNLNGTLSGDTGSGAIKGSGSITQFHADTGSGAIHIVSDVPVVQNSKADTGSGGVTIALPATASFSLKADSGSGGVSCDFPLSNVSSVGKNHIVGTVNDGGPQLLVDTGSGAISIKITD